MALGGLLLDVLVLVVTIALLSVLWMPIGTALDGGRLATSRGLLLVGFVAIWLGLLLAAGAVHAWRFPTWWAISSRHGREAGLRLAAGGRRAADRNGPRDASFRDGTQCELVLRAGGPCGAAVGSSASCSASRPASGPTRWSASDRRIFTVVSALAFPGPLADPTRIAAQIVSGIGFLGGGAILHYRGSVRGLTTAASLWAVAAVGMAAGAGLYVVAVGGAALVIITLEAFDGLRAASAQRRLGSVASRENSRTPEDGTWIREDRS